MKTSNSFLLFAVCTFAILACANSKLTPKPVSEYFIVCKRGDQAKLNACLKKSVTEAKQMITKGIAALGLVPLEPLVIPRLELNQGSGRFGLKTTLTNFTFHGLSAYEVTRANATFAGDSFNFDLDMLTPKVYATANYDIDGQILVLPIRGQGFCEFNFTQLLTKSNTVGKIVDRNGKKHIEITKVTWDISADSDRSSSWFHNLFNGDKRLGDATNNFLNSNQAEAFMAIKHLPEEAFGEVFRDFSRRVYDVYTLDELFPLE